MSPRKEIIGECEIWLGDMREVLPQLVGIHACVTDPPYHLTSIVKRFGSETAKPVKKGKTGAYARQSKGFMGQTWDGGDVAFQDATWRLVYDALLPGAHLAAFSGSRTYHHMATAIERSGFEVRDMLMWLYGSGFPKSHDVSKAIDKAAGAAMKRGYVAGDGGLHRGAGNTVGKFTGKQLSPHGYTEDAKKWEGWGTALKPAHEPIAFARKRLSEGSIAKNVLKYGTGAINVDGARVGASGAPAGANYAKTGLFGIGGKAEITELDAGRWPANVLHDGSVEVVSEVPRPWREFLRFFYSAKATKAERDFGLRDRPAIAASGVYSGRRDGTLGKVTDKRVNHHPTVKPVDLMRWLCRLICPPGGVVLDPFCGSGSTGIAAVREGFRFVGVEQSPEYFDIARRRVEAAVKEAEREPTLTREIDKALAVIRAKQIDLFIPENAE